jgi:amino-acid N-acetyltransferase
VQYRFASTVDLPIINRRLAEAHLPHSDLSLHLRHFILAIEAEAIVGIIGLEVYERIGLLRSLVVTLDARKRGIGGDLVERLCEHAIAQGVCDLYLLTVDAQDYFSRRGFRRIERSLAPTTIRTTRQFNELCPSSAVLMYRGLLHADMSPIPDPNMNETVPS